MAARSRPTEQNNTTNSKNAFQSDFPHSIFCPAALAFVQRHSAGSSALSSAPFSVSYRINGGEG
jgi:hypothetical protein